jgi:hypothetical protein
VNLALSRRRNSSNRDRPSGPIPPASSSIVKLAAAILAADAQPEIPSAPVTRYQFGKKGCEEHCPKLWPCPKMPAIRMLAGRGVVCGDNHE